MVLLKRKGKRLINFFCSIIYAFLFYNYTNISSTFLELLIVFYFLNFLDVITTNYGLRMGAY